jgi:hypothetical protein
MTQARRHLVPPQSSVAVHCVQRCVRRAFLCGVDSYSGRSFEHRKAWVEERLHYLAQSFAVGIHAYAVMSNHLHVVLQCLPELAQQWPEAEVAERWLRLFPARVDDEAAHADKLAALLANPGRLARCRGRLANLSWFMRCLAEPLARRANAEDSCKGRFWEGRFKSQLLLDARALLAAMVYVDLNPIRAGITDRIENSRHTSLFERLQRKGTVGPASRRPMLTLAGVPLAACLPLADYMHLVDWTGRQLAPGKRGVIRGAPPAGVLAVGAAPRRWADEIRGIGTRYWRAVGSAQALGDLAASLGQRWMRGIGFARSLSKA